MYVGQKQKLAVLTWQLRIRIGTLSLIVERSLRAGHMYVLVTRSRAQFNLIVSIR